MALALARALMVALPRWTGGWLLQWPERLGRYIVFCMRTLKWVMRAKHRYREILAQMVFVGEGSIGIICLMGAFTGGVFGLQIAGLFAVFRVEAMMGGATALALASELAPLVSGFVLAGRVGASMTAEIATMVVGEQVAALEAFGVDPLDYLVMPRLLACFVMVPLLAGFFLLTGVAGAFVVGRLLFDVDAGVFWLRMSNMVEPVDVMRGLRKAFAFGGIIATVACYGGLHAAHGAKGVGEATTLAVVRSLLLMLCVDFIASYIDVQWLS